MKLSTKVAYNTIIQIISKFTATALGLVVVGILTRYLGQAGFGKYTTIMAFLSLFGIMADLGLTLVTAQMVSEPGADQQKILNNLFSIRFFSALILLGIAPLVVLLFPYEANVKWGVLIGAFSFLFISLNQILVGFFQNRLRMDKVSISEVVGRLVLVLGVILVAYFSWGLLGAMVAIVIANGINFLLHFSFAQKFIKIRFRFDWSYWITILKKSWPLAATIVLNLVYLKGDILILSLIDSQKDVGLYGASYKVIDVVVMIPFIFAGILLPIITSAWANKEKERFEDIVQRGFNYMAILALPLVVGAQFLSQQIMEIVAGKDFFMSGEILQILVWAAFFVFLAAIFSHAIIAINKQKKVIWAYVLTSVTSLAGYFIFIPKYSYYGAAWMTVYSEALIFILVLYCLWKYTRYLPKLGIFFKSLLASLAMGVLLLYLPASYYSSILGLCLTLLGAMVFYFLVLSLLGGISREEANYILNK